MITPNDITIEEYNSAIAFEAPTHARITFIQGNFVFQDNELDYNGGITVSSYMNPDQEMSFGTAFSKEAVVHLMRSEKTDNLNWSTEFKLEFGVENGNDIEWVTIGYFTGTRPTWDMRDVIEVVAYDRMIRFEKKASDFLKTVTFPCTMQELYDALCTFVVVENEAGDEISSVMDYTYDSADIFPQDISCRELMTIIAKANGCYAKITNEGKVKMIWFNDHSNDYLLDMNDCFDMDVSYLRILNKTQWKDLEAMQWKDLENLTYKYYDNEDANKIPIKSVSLQWNEDGTEMIITQPEEGTSSSWGQVKGESNTWGDIKQYVWGLLFNDSSRNGNAYIFVGNPLIKHDTEAEVREHLQFILNRAYGFNLDFAVSITAVGNWLVEAGDIIMIEIERGTKFAKVPIFNQVLYWNGSCTAEYETTGNINTNDIYL